MDSIDYYDRYAVPYYEETVELSMEEQLQRFMDLLPENAEVLDLGCGSGRDTLFLEDEGFSVTAMDGSARMCELAEIHTAGISCICAWKTWSLTMYFMVSGRVPYWGISRRTRSRK